MVSFPCEGGRVSPREESVERLVLDWCFGLRVKEAPRLADEVMVCVSDGVRSNLCSQIDWFFPKIMGALGWMIDAVARRRPLSSPRFN